MQGKTLIIVHWLLPIQCIIQPDQMIQPKVPLAVCPLPSYLQHFISATTILRQNDTMDPQ